LLNELLDTQQHSKLQDEGYILTASSLFDLGRFRVTASKQRGTYSVSMSIATNVDEIEDVKLPSVMNNLYSIKEGLILITGPAGSGKTITCGKILQDINTNRCSSIVTIENPITYLFNHGKGIIKQKEVGLDVDSLFKGLTTSLEEDSDVIFVDDISQMEVLDAAISAAEKGKLVIGCLSTKDVKTTLEYVLKASEVSEIAIRKLKMANVLRAVVSHKKVSVDNLDDMSLHEVLINTGIVKKLILEDKLVHLKKTMDMHSEMGMMTFDHCLKLMVEDNVVDPNKAKHLADKESLIIQKTDSEVS